MEMRLFLTQFSLRVHNHFAFVALFLVVLPIHVTLNSPAFLVNLFSTVATMSACFFRYMSCIPHAGQVRTRIFATLPATRHNGRRVFIVESA
jgi:hypothetical protein